MDEQDKKILRLLQQNNRLTAEELGTQVNLSTSAVQRRIKRLRDEKIIEADICIVSPRAVGFDITCIVDVVLHHGTSKAIDQFKELMLVREEVMQCYYVTGTYDFVIILNTKDMQEYEAFSKKWLMDNPLVKHFYTHVVMDRAKVGYGVAI
jgi:Lrp/AsnC family leucine-responsive transcriptional regulator